MRDTLCLNNQALIETTTVNPEEDDEEPKKGVSVHSVAEFS